MGNRIKTIEDLPQWFFSTSYEATKLFKMSDWYVAFYNRARTQEKLHFYNIFYNDHMLSPDEDCFEMIDYMNKRLISETEDLMNTSRHQLDLFMNRINSNKLSPIHKNNITSSPLRFIDTRALTEFRPEEINKQEDEAINQIKKSHEAECLRDAEKTLQLKALEDADLPKRDLQKSKVELELHYKKIIAIESRSLELKIKLLKANMNSGIAFLKVDTHASDIQLMEDFERWLKLYRKKIGEKNLDISQSKINSWNEYKVLKYIDLMQWETLFRVKINKTFLSSILYPDEQYVNPSRIDTTLPDLMKKVLDKKHIQRVKLRATT